MVMAAIATVMLVPYRILATLYYISEVSTLLIWKVQSSVPSI